MERSERNERAIEALCRIGWVYTAHTREWKKAGDTHSPHIDNETMRTWISRNPDRCIEGYLRAFPGVGTKEIAEVFDFKVPTVRKKLKVMLMQNLVTTVGNGAWSSPTAKWRWAGQ